MNDKEYLNEVLPNGRTIAEQQNLDLQLAMGIYPDDISDYLGMKIVSNTIPSKEGFDNLNEDEKTFFLNFHAKLIEAKYNPVLAKLTRLSNGAFNVEYVGLCYIGKIYLYKEPEIYAVIKKGDKHATKQFSTFREAQLFVEVNDRCEIQTISVQSEAYIQYSIGFTSIKELHNLSLQQCIEAIPRWIKYLNYCKRH